MRCDEVCCFLNILQIHIATNYHAVHAIPRSFFYMANPGAELIAGEGGGTDRPDLVLMRASQLFLVGLPCLYIEEEKRLSPCSSNWPESRELRTQTSFRQTQAVQ